MSAVLTQTNNVFRSILHTSSATTGASSSSSIGSSSSMLEVSASSRVRNKQQQSSTTTTTFTTIPPKVSILDVCHRKIRLLGGGPVAFLGGLVAKARRKDKEASAPGADDPKLYLEEAVLERKHPDLDLRLLVELPAGLDYNEWLASHTIAFFDHINLIYGTISEFCTMSGCPDMTGPGLRTYLWFDEKGKKTKVAAPQYIDYVMTFTQKTINDESIFPTKYANEFPSSFESLVKKILRLLFHVVAHMYHSHFKEIVFLNLHAHLNSVFAHMTIFNERFRLIEDKETEILQDLVTALRVHAGSEQDSSSSSSCAPASTSSTTSKENNNFLSAEGDSVGDVKTSASEEEHTASSSSQRDVTSTPTRLQQESATIAQQHQPQSDGGGATTVVSG